ncbi:MAG TPA: hypothetical protein VGH10_01630, partial [Actinomycetota bacterium]
MTRLKFPSNMSIRALWKSVAYRKSPSDFGRFSNDLLIGNFGNGRINAYKPGAGGTYTHVGQL